MGVLNAAEIAAGGGARRSDIQNKVANWIKSTNGPGAAYGTMSSPPTVTHQGNASTINANGNGACSHAWDNSKLTHIGARLVSLGGSPSRAVPKNVTYGDGSRDASTTPNRIRFITDAPAVEACFRHESTGVAIVGAICDGEFVGRDTFSAYNVAALANYKKFDFGADTMGRGLRQVQKNAGGSGYANSEIITLAGGTFTTAAKVRVIGQSGGVITGVEVVDPGIYSVLPSTFTQGSTTGSGTGATFSSPIWTQTHTTRKMRRWEIIWQGDLSVYGINIDSRSVLLPYPEPTWKPKLVGIGDSQTAGKYLDYAGGHMMFNLAQRLGLADRMEINALASTGWLKDASGGNYLKWSDSRRIADFIESAGDIYVWFGSQNDSGLVTADVQAAVTAAVSGVLAGRPNSYHIGFGPVVMSDGSTATTLSAAIGAGFVAADPTRCIYVDNISEAWLFGTGDASSDPGTGNRAFWQSSDSTHIGQAGNDFLAAILAVRVWDAINQMVTY